MLHSKYISSAQLPHVASGYDIGYLSPKKSMSYDM